MKQYLNELQIILGERASNMKWMGVIFTLLSVFDIAGIWLIGPFISLTVPSSSISISVRQFLSDKNFDISFSQLILIAGVLLLILFSIKSILSICINRIILKFCGDIRYGMQLKLLRLYHTIQYEEFEKKSSGEYIYMVQELTRRFDEQVLLPLLRTSSDAVVGIGIMLILFYTNPTALMILVCLFSMLIFIYDRVIKYKLQAYGEIVRSSSVNMNNCVKESIEGIKEIRLLGKSDYFFDKMKIFSSQFSNANVNALTYASAPRYAIELVFTSFVILLILISITNGGSAGDLMAVMGVFGLGALRLLPATNNLILTITQLRFNRDCVSKLSSAIAKLESLPKELNKGNIECENISSFETLRLSNVSFKYSDSSSYVLKNLDLEIKAGDLIGIVGASGSGKTTLLNVLLSLLNRTDGDIYINGHELDSHIKSWRSMMGYLPQQAFLIDGTFKTNIALGEFIEDINTIKLVNAARQSQLIDYINLAKNQFNSAIGESGNKLSGGQRQRVSLARAFYFDRQVLVMDEATSALDIDTEEEIIHEIRNLKGKRTVIIVSHRLNTLVDCDIIYKLENGRLTHIPEYKFA